MSPRQPIKGLGDVRHKNAIAVFRWGEALAGAGARHHVGRVSYHHVAILTDIRCPLQLSGVVAVQGSVAKPATDQEEEQPYQGFAHKVHRIVDFHLSAATMQTCFASNRDANLLTRRTASGKIRGAFRMDLAPILTDVRETRSRSMGQPHPITIGHGYINRRDYQARSEGRLQPRRFVVGLRGPLGREASVVPGAKAPKKYAGNRRRR